MSTRSFFRVLLLIVITIVLITLSTGASLIYGSSIEGRFFPVVKDGFAHILEETPTSVTLLAGGNKVRACDYTASTALTLKNGKWSKVDLIVDPKYLTTTTNGVQTFGVYKVMDSGWEQVKFSGQHRCHTLWTTISVWIDLKYSDIGKVETR